jgi:hypothetical protein
MEILRALNFLAMLHFTPKMLLLMGVASSIRDDRLPEASPLLVQDHTPHVGLRRRVLMLMLGFLQESPVFRLTIAIWLLLSLVLLICYILLEAMDPMPATDSSRSPSPRRFRSPPPRRPRSAPPEGCMPEPYRSPRPARSMSR